MTTQFGQWPEFLYLKVKVLFPPYIGSL